MGIKITFTDTSSGKVLAEDELTDEQVKALNTELELADYVNPVTGKKHTGIIAWALNVLGQKARQKVDEIVELSGKGSRHTPIDRKLEIIREVEKDQPELLKSAKQRMEELMTKERSKNAE